MAEERNINQNINKVLLANGTVLIDTSGVTVTPDYLLEGYTALDKSGTLITGTMQQQTVVVSEENDSHGGKVVYITGDTINLQAKTVTPTKNAQNVGPDSGYNGLSVITVNPIPNEYIKPTGTLSINANNTYDVTNYASVTVNVSNSSSTINLQEKTATPSETEQEIVADNAYDGLSKVTVGAISSTYVGTGITRRNSNALTVNGATVTAPAGYYANAASKSIASGSATTPATTITANPSINISNTGLITVTASASKSVTPTVSKGYVSTGTAGTITVNGSNTQQLTTKAAATITPGTTNQEIAAGTYLTGKQTIAGDADLIASNIKTGVNIFGVSGTFTGDATAAAADILAGETAYVNGSKITGALQVVTYYTGSTAPTSSLGNDGDIYFMR